MAERRKLVIERRMLGIHRLRVRYGPVLRGNLVSLARMPGCCIDCGLDIMLGQKIVPAAWHRLSNTGFYAHETCPDPLDASEWLRDQTFITVFDRCTVMTQRCRGHPGNQVTARAINLQVSTDGAGLIRYVCEECVAS